MNLNVEIRRNADCALATDVYRDWAYNEYWWAEGNASCDCNRARFFLQASKEDDSGEHACGDGAYSVRLTNVDTGEVLYDELKTPT